MDKENIITIVEKDQAVLNNEKKRSCPTRHLVGVFVVRKEDVEEAGKRIKEGCVLTEKEGRQWVGERFGAAGNGEDVVVEEIRVSLCCPMSQGLIETPVRGAFCSHVSCFDLMTFLRLMVNTRVPNWKCPICNTLAA